MEDIKTLQKIADWCRRYADLAEDKPGTTKRRWIAAVLEKIIAKSKRCSDQS